MSSGPSGRIWKLASVFGITMLFMIVALVGYGQSGWSPGSSAQPAFNWPGIALVLTAEGLTQPVHVTHAGDGSERLFVIERAGTIRIVRNGNLEPTPFLSITSRVGSTGGEQGLFSVAFPPNYATKGYFYVHYTDLNGDTVVSRLYLTDNPDVADPFSEEVILTVDQPYANHNGGQLAFGPDGYLYIGLGDGGGGGDLLGNAQNPAVLLGKILRIEVEPMPFVSPTFTVTHHIYLPFISRGGPALPYRIPPTNPFTQTPGYRGEIWALGLRNPWRFSFDRAAGDLYIGDVGQNAYEEINFQPASSPGGENYGWNIMEGTHCYPAGPCDSTGFVLPVAEYDHSRGCSVTGGAVYRGPDTGLQSIYFYGDYCSGRIWGLIQKNGTWLTQELLDTALNITSFGEDEAGNVYVTDYWNGRIYQLVQVP